MGRDGEGWCLVLSGGGAKGVYHLGVWRALRELGHEVDALVGTSIGAIFAAFLAQGREDVLETIISSIAPDSLFTLPPEWVEDGELKLDRASFPSVRSFFSALLEKRGLDTGPLRRLLADHLDEALVRASGKDLGFVTLNLSDLTPRQVFLDEVEPGRLIDYLMASAAFPGFELPVIDGKRYVDGGLYDNIPFALARARGYRRVIVSDIAGMGRNRRPEVEGGVTAYVRASVKMGGVLELDPKFLEEFQRLGLLDTLRTFGRLVGTSYFVEPDPGAEAEARNLPALPDRYRQGRQRLLATLECAATIVGLPRIHRHTYPSLAQAIRDQRDEEERGLASLLGDPGEGRRSLMSLVGRDAVQALQGSPYQTWRVAEELLPGKAGDVLRRTLVGLCPELPTGLAWLRG